MTTQAIMKLIILYSNVFHVNPSVALNVAKLESNFNPNAISQTFDVGVFQLNEKSFPQYTLKQLEDPRINIKLGVKYLADMKKKCVHQHNLEWLSCYNLGINKAKRIKHPDLWPYVQKINWMMAVNNY